MGIANNFALIIVCYLDGSPPALAGKATEIPCSVPSEVIVASNADYM